MKKTTTAYIALGSSVGEREDYLNQALKELSKRCGAILAYSQVYETKPLPLPEGSTGVYEGKNFFNMVAAVETKLSASNTLQECLAVELLLGRKREQELRWGPRTIDLDLIDFGGEIHSATSLILPHPRFHERDFVLLPLAEIAPRFTDIRFNIPISQYVADLREADATILRNFPLNSLSIS